MEKPTPPKCFALKGNRHIPSQNYELVDVYEDINYSFFIKGRSGH